MVRRAFPLLFFTLTACGTPQLAAEAPTQTPIVIVVTATPLPATITPASVLHPTATPMPTQTPEPSPTVSITKNWQSFTSADGRFQVLLPVRPEEQVQSIDTPIGPIPFHMFVVQRSDRAYFVGYNDYPSDVVAQRGSEMVLAGAVDGAVSNVQGKLVQVDDIELAGHPGKAFVAEGTSATQATSLPSDGILHGRTYLVGDRLYQVMVIGYADSVRQEEVDAFFTSFSLTE